MIDFSKLNQGQRGGQPGLGGDVRAQQVPQGGQQMPTPSAPPPQPNIPMQPPSILPPGMGMGSISQQGQQGGQPMRTPIQPGGFTPVQPPAQPPAAPPSQPDWLPQMPDISGLHPNIDPGMVQNMWANLYNPESGWNENIWGGGEQYFGEQPEYGTISQYMSDPLRHAQEVFKWSPEQMRDVWGALGWEKQMSVEPPKPDDWGEPGEPDIPPEDEVVGPISSCFIAQTPIQVSPHRTKNIEDIQVGDSIISYDIENDCACTSKVAEVFEHDADQYLLINESLGVTKNHPVFLGGEWKEIGNAKVGNSLTPLNGKNPKISSIKKINKSVKVYDLEVKNYHNYYADGYLVHNKMYVDGGGVTPGGDWGGTPGAGAPDTITGGYPPTQPTQAFPFPSQWGTASNVMEQFARGMPTQLPQQWGEMMGGLGEMAQTGAPVDVGEWWQAQQPLAERFIKEQSEQAMEQAGLRGLRYSTPAQRTIGDITGRTTENLWGQLAGMDVGAQEQARGRQMGAYQTALPYMQMPTQLAESAKTRGLAAAQGLMGVGGAYAQLPMQASQQAMNMSQQLQQMQQQQISPIYQEFLRRIPENSPWLQMAQGLVNPIGSQYQQYQPGGFGQAMNMGVDAATIYAMMKMGAAASSIEFKKDVENLTEEDEQTIAEKMTETPLFNYRYKFETDETVPHLGPITETSSQEFTLFDNKAVGFMEYLGALHATIKTLNRRVNQLEAR